MQILKGDRMKSVTIRNIFKNTNSYCFIYNDNKIPIIGSYYVNSKYTTLNELKGYLQGKIDSKNSEIEYDYFILYTNNTEKELSNLIAWIDGKELDFNCQCILVTCK